MELPAEEGSRQKLCRLQNFVDCSPASARAQEAHFKRFGDLGFAVGGVGVLRKVREVEVSVAQKMFAAAVFLALLPLSLVQHKIEHKYGNRRIIGVFFWKSRSASVGVVVGRSTHGQNGANGVRFWQ